MSQLSQNGFDTAATYAAGPNPGGGVNSAGTAVSAASGSALGLLGSLRDFWIGVVIISGLVILSYFGLKASGDLVLDVEA